MSKPIASNRTKRIAAIFADATSIKSYRLDRGFAPFEVEPRRALECFVEYKGKMRDNLNGTYTVDFHSNWWLEIKAAANA